MTNIVKETLLEKQVALQEKLGDLLTAEKEIILSRVRTAFKEAIDYIPVEATIGYETVYFKVEGREILSINKRYADKPYLNTYATFIEGDFELRRLIFNGMVAKIVLENSNIYDEIFAETELKEQIIQERTNLHTIKCELDFINRQEQERVLAEKKAKLTAGEEIEFDRLKTIEYAAGAWRSISRVKSIKVQMTSKAKGTVTFKVQNWGGETFQEYIQENVNINRYILHHLN